MCVCVRMCVCVCVCIIHEMCVSFGDEHASVNGCRVMVWAQDDLRNDLGVSMLADRRKIQRSAGQGGVGPQPVLDPLLEALQYCR